MASVRGRMVRSPWRRPMMMRRGPHGTARGAASSGSHHAVRRARATADVLLGSGGEVSSPVVVGGPTGGSGVVRSGVVGRLARRHGGTPRRRHKGAPWRRVLRGRPAAGIGDGTGRGGAGRRGKQVCFWSTRECISFRRPRAPQRIFACPIRSDAMISPPNQARTSSAEEISGGRVAFRRDARNHERVRS